MDTETVKHKEAKTDYPVHDLIKKRWSPRAFAEKPVNPELIKQLFDAARWAPSSYNEQPWRFIVARRENSEEFEQLAEVLMDGNSWAKEAPVLGLTIVKTFFEKNGKSNRVAEHDLGQAMSYLTLEAMRHDIYVHQMAGIHLDKARELFDIPEKYEPVTMFALGYLGKPGQLPEKLQKSERAERTRLDINEIVFRGGWENRKEL